MSSQAGSYTPEIEAKWESIKEGTLLILDPKGFQQERRYFERREFFGTVVRVTQKIGIDLWVKHIKKDSCCLAGYITKDEIEYVSIVRYRQC